jgi:hypothetical protein
MSVAQVLNTSGGNSAEPPPPEAQAMTDATKALDGCEHIYVLGNSSGGPGMAIIVWRDEVAMKAAADHIAADNAKLEGMGLTVTVGATYDTFAEL